MKLKHWPKLACLLGALVGAQVKADTPAMVNPKPSSVAKPLYAGAPVVEKILETFADKPPPVAWQMVAIAYCESNDWVHRLPDGSLRPHSQGASSARGTLQVLAKLHGPELKKRGLVLARDSDYFTYVEILYEQSGFAPWQSSRSCWAGPKGKRAKAKARALLYG